MAKRKRRATKPKKANPTPAQPSAQPSGLPAPSGPQLVRFNLDPVLSNIFLKPNTELFQNIINKRNDINLVAFILRDQVKLMPNIIHPFFEILKSIGKNDELDIFLSTTGGATEVPWRIVSLIREFCKKFNAIIPFVSLSAGTHIALGADKLIMSEISTLSPVDPTTSHPLLPKDNNGKPIPVSVEDLKNCIKFISQQLQDQDDNEKYSPSDMANIVGHLFEHIEPLAIGAVERSYALSRLITRRVLETHLNPEQEKDKINRIVNRIGGEYYSHSFPITVRDVEQDLRLPVERPDTNLFESIWKLHEYYKTAFSQIANFTLTVDSAPQKGGAPQRRNILFEINVLGYLDCITERRVLLELKEMKKDPGSDKIIQQPVLVRWIKPKGDLPTESTNYFQVKLDNS
jgi:hypothetical protein